MKGQMTVLKLEILLHYYAHVGDYRNGDFSAPAVREAIEEFTGEAGLLCVNIKQGRNELYKLSEKGKFYVDHLKTIPLPKTSYVIENVVVSP